MTPRLLALAATASLAAVSPAQAPDPGGLGVLLVGHDPKAPKVSFEDLAQPRTYRLMRERTAAWEALLRYHFGRVEVVHANDYTPDMSARFDVTVFDAVPPAITPGQTVPVRRPASHLPESFDRPAILIAESAPRIGEPIGLKLDWL